MSSSIRLGMCVLLDKLYGRMCLNLTHLTNVDRVLDIIMFVGVLMYDDRAPGGLLPML